MAPSLRAFPQDADQINQPPSTVPSTRRTTRQLSRGFSDNEAQAQAHPKKRGIAAMDTLHEREETGINQPFRGGNSKAVAMVKGKAPGRNVLSSSDRPNGREGPQTSFIARQVNATKVDPIDPALSDAVSEPVLEAQLQNQRQMGAPQVNMSRNAEPPAAKRVRMAESPEIDDEYVPDPSSATQDSVVQEDRSDRYASSYAEANRLSKQLTMTHKLGKVPQQRKAWESEEIGTFIRLIGECGPSYSAIKNRDDNDGKVLALRSQINLKDKARNMKFDYLKSQIPLPEGFEQIVLDKKLRDKLEDMGIQYSQEQVRKVR